jgi:hypothetical protein
VAEIWRGVAREAEHVGLVSPGYHSVRSIVRAERERRAAQAEALIVAVSELPRYAPQGFRIVDALATAHALRRRDAPNGSTGTVE